MRTVAESYDVVVCGGGLAGFSAAMAAARHGAQTALIQDRPVLGGNSSSEIRVTPHGSGAFHGYARETGIISEALIQDRVVNHAKIEENGWTNSVWDMVLYDMAFRTPGLTLHLNTALEDATVDDGQITKIMARTMNAELLHEISGDAFIDCTGDGTLGDISGNPSRQGMESSDEYGEQFAPEVSSDGTMGNSLHFKTVDTGKPTPFKAPDWAVRYDDESFFVDGGRAIPTLDSGYWWIELGTPWDTLYENEEIRHELTRHVLGIWDYLKNRHPYWSQHASTRALDWVGQVPGKRESRRLIGRHVLDESDLIDLRKFDDEVAFGGWYMDLHTIGGLLKEVAEPVTQGVWTKQTRSSQSAKHVGPFGIPLSALTSGTLKNLFFAGRNISATHVAMAATRVMGTTAIMGEAVGIAAARNHAAEQVTDAAADDIRNIQQTLLRDGCFLVNVANEDPLDLARKADISASTSEAVYGVGPSTPDRLGGIDYWRGHPIFPFKGVLERRLAQWIARGADQPLRTIELCLTNHGVESGAVKAKLHQVESIWDYRTDPAEPLATATLEVPAGGPQWVKWEVDLPAAEKTGFVRIDLEPAEDIEWHVSPAVQPGQIACFEESPNHYRRFGGGQSLSFKVDPPQQAYEPGQVISGETRPHNSTNQWRSDPAVPLPQWIELAWDKPHKIQQLQITFPGHLLREYHAYPPHYRDPQCAQAYEIQTWTGGTWVTRVQITDNTTTRVVHTLEEPVSTDKVRIVVNATNGDPSAGIYEIRCYEDIVCTRPSYPAEIPASGQQVHLNK